MATVSYTTHNMIEMLQVPLETYTCKQVHSPNHNALNGCYFFKTQM